MILAKPTVMTIDLRDNTPYQPSPALTENQFKDLSQICNRPLSDLLHDNPDLMVFAPQVDNSVADEQDIRSSYVMSCHAKEDDTVSLSTGNTMGFIGVGDIEINIMSRFAHNNDDGQGNEGGNENDFFLHYMLQRVFSLSILNWDHATDSALRQFDWRLYFFPYYLSEALSQGLYKEYRTFRHNDSRIKGVIDVARHIRINTPFLGKVAYNTRQHTHDNAVLQLVRHTIEYIRKTDIGKTLLRNRPDIASNISQIVAATPSYEENARSVIIRENMHKPVCHPYFSKYRDLQSLCLQILRHETLRYADTNKDKVHGILFDGAWLWEEYLNRVFGQHRLGLIHPRNKTGKDAIYLDANHDLRRYPDFYKGQGDNSVVLDAKYKSSVADRDDIHQIIAYLYRLQSKFGAFILPGINKNPDQPDEIITQKWHLDGYGRQKTILAQIHLPIPQHADCPKEFADEMNENEQTLITALKSVMF